MNLTRNLDLYIVPTGPVRNASGRLCLQGPERAEVEAAGCRSVVHEIENGSARVTLRGSRAALERYLKGYAQDDQDMQFHMSRVYRS